MHHLLDVCSGVERTDLERWSRDRTQPLMMSVRLCHALVLGLMRLLVWLLMDRLVKTSSPWNISANVILLLPCLWRAIHNVKEKKSNQNQNKIIQHLRSSLLSVIGMPLRLQNNALHNVMLIKLSPHLKVTSFPSSGCPTRKKKSSATKIINKNR